MRCNLALILTGALTLGLAAAAEARSANTVEVALTKCLDTATATNYFEAVPPTTQLVPEGARPVSAILELRLALVSGQEVELWMDTGTDRKPWDRREEYGLRRAQWVADDRTGSLVRFDITDLVRTWTADLTATRPKLLIRVAPDGEGDAVSIRASEAPSARLVIRTR